MTAPVSIQQAFRQAMQHHQAGQLREAEAIYRQVLAQQPEHADALQMLGILGHQLGRSADGIELVRRAIAINSQVSEYHANLGAMLASVRQPEAAAAEFRQALSLRPNSPETQNNLGKALKEIAQLDEAIAAFRQAIALRTNFAEAHNQLGDALRDTGQLDEAIASYRRAMALTPDPRWGSSLLYAIHLHPDYDAIRIGEAHLRWNQTYAETLGSSIPIHRNDPSPDRRLRIGYVWADQRQTTPVNQLVLHHDRDAFEIFCYSSAGVPDPMAEKLHGRCDTWREIASMNDQQIAEIVVQDRIDVLVDLSMHLPSNRLLVFARKPAPVQITGLAYPSTTGLNTIDYRLSDPSLDPIDGLERRSLGRVGASYSEETLLLPETLFCFDPPTEAVAANELPATTSGCVTFGCLNDFAAVSGRTLDLWSKVLTEITRSRLLIAAPTGSARDRVLAKLEERRVDATRIEFVDRPQPTDLSLYQRIDIALDTYPRNGVITTFNALWMGVPVLTLSGGTAVSRIGRSILSNAGVTSPIATDEAGFVAAATGMASNLNALAALRSNLRQRVASSALVDGSRFTRNAERAYRQTWETWCRTQLQPAPVAL